MRRDRKNILIGALLFAIIAMSVGYASFATTLNIKGTAKIDNNWNVAITNITSTSTGEAIDNTLPSYTALTATFDALLKKPGDAMTYTIKVENKGSIDAMLNTISLTPQTDGESAIIYTVIDSPKEGDVLLAGDSASVVIKAEYDSNSLKSSNSSSKTFTGTIEYVQK